MEWIISIENRSKDRIVVDFDPLNNQICFFGQHRHKNEWITFVVLTRAVEITNEEVQTTLIETYESLKVKIEQYNNVSDIFNDIKIVEIKE